MAGTECFRGGLHKKGGEVGQVMWGIVGQVWELGLSN